MRINICSLTSESFLVLRANSPLLLFGSIFLCLLLRGSAPPFPPPSIALRAQYLLARRRYVIREFELINMSRGLYWYWFFYPDLRFNSSVSSSCLHIFDISFIFLVRMMCIKAIFFQNSILLKVNEYRKLTGSAETKKKYIFNTTSSSREKY